MSGVVRSGLSSFSNPSETVGRFEALARESISDPNVIVLLRLCRGVVRRGIPAVSRVTLRTTGRRGGAGLVDTVCMCFTGRNGGENTGRLKVCCGACLSHVTCYHTVPVPSGVATGDVAYIAEGTRSQGICSSQIEAWYPAENCSIESQELQFNLSNIIMDSPRNSND